MDISVHVSGVDALIRKFDRKIEGVDDALDDGCSEAADYLIDSIQDKFGHYQDGWEKLKYDTIKKKVRKGNSANASKPLIDYGDMMYSFYKVISNRSRKHTVTVSSDDPKLIYHVYGAPSANLPRRDPVRPTVRETRDRCLEIIANKMKEVWRRE